MSEHIFCRQAQNAWQTNDARYCAIAYCTHCSNKATRICTKHLQTRCADNVKHYERAQWYGNHRRLSWWVLYLTTLSQFYHRIRMQIKWQTMRHSAHLLKCITHMKTANFGWGNVLTHTKKEQLSKIDPNKIALQLKMLYNPAPACITTHVIISHHISRLQPKPGTFLGTRWKYLIHQQSMSHCTLQRLAAFCTCLLGLVINWISEMSQHSSSWHG